MNEVYSKIILTGILIALVLIALKPSANFVSSPVAPPASVTVTGGDIIQIAPNIIGVKDSGSHSGYSQLLIFEYDEQKKSFTFTATLNTEEYLTHPEKYGIPFRENTLPPFTQ